MKRTSELLHIDLIQYAELILDQKTKMLDPRLEQLQAKLAELQSRVNDAKDSVRATVQQKREQVTATLQQKREQVTKDVSASVEEAKVRLHVLKRSSEAMSQLSLKYVRTTSMAALPRDVVALATHYYTNLGAAFLRQQQQEEVQKEQEQEQQDEYAELDSHLLNLAEAVWGVMVFWRKNDVNEEDDEKDDEDEMAKPEQVSSDSDEIDADADAEFLNKAENTPLL